MSSYKLLKKCVSIMLLYFHIVKSSEAQLQVGFYQKSCDGAGVVRLHFHDCFVRGCDGSVLLNSTRSNKAEKDAPPNNPSIPAEAFQVIDNAKAALEDECKGVVSCADILAFAARDSFELTQGLGYDVFGGRRDGTVSLASEALSNLPSPAFNLTQLTQSFADKGLTQDDMVTLSGGHTLGRSLCSSVVKRLYNFSSTSSLDPTLDPKYAAQLKQMCQKGSKDANTTEVPMDSTPLLADAEYYGGVMKNRGLFTSDQSLLTSPQTKKLVKQYAYNQNLWNRKFAVAMVKMGNIAPLTAGEIRKDCRKINKKRV